WLLHRDHCGAVCFFFQAEDGIRDRNVTGVQTCALPIYRRRHLRAEHRPRTRRRRAHRPRPGSRQALRPAHLPTHRGRLQLPALLGGGVELTIDAGLGLLRPKAVGGGSIVNQALMDRFDDVAFSSWRDQSGVSWLNEDDLADYYDRAEGNMILKNVPEQWRNGNAKNFAEGFDANGYRYAPLRRGEADCRFEDGNCCVE